MRILGVGLCALVLFSNALSAQPRSETTTLLLTADRDCVVSIDGEDVGPIGADVAKKVQVSRGEHLVSAACGASKWRQVVKVEAEQKVVLISTVGQAGTTAQAPVAPADSNAAPGTGVARILEKSGRLVIAAVVKDGPAWNAGVRAGGIIVSLNGKKAQELTTASLEELDAGPAGSSLDATVLTTENEVKQVSIVRGRVPTAGTMQVLLVDGKTVVEKAFTALNREAVANTGEAFKPPVGFAPLSSNLISKTCQKCFKKPAVGGSLYCEDHKCQHPGCKSLEAWPSDYCFAHKALHGR